MIVGSLLLILVAVVLLGVGLVQGSNPLLISSIAASLLAAVALVVGARQAAANRVDERDEFDGGQRRSADEDALSQVRVPTRRSGLDLDDAGSAASPYRSAGTSEALPEPPARTTPPWAAAKSDLAGRDLVEAGAEATDLDGDALLDGNTVPDTDDEDPPDEPARQRVAPADAARVARLSTEVLVVDSRPRYHLTGCMHLVGRESEPVPVSEAVELGFTPCGLCEPDNALLAEAHRV